MRSGGRRHRSRSNSRSRSRSGGFDWLNTKERDVCHRCGRPGHRSSRCMADMPQWVKDKIMREVDDRAATRSADAHVVADAHAASWYFHEHVASDTEPEPDGADNDGEVDMPQSGYFVEGPSDDEGTWSRSRPSSSIVIPLYSCSIFWFARARSKCHPTLGIVAKQWGLPFTFFLLPDVSPSGGVS